MNRRQVMQALGGLGTLSALGALLPAGLPAAALAANSAPMGSGNPGERERNYFTDTILLDQNGKERRFYSDMLRGRTVLINFMFTGCSDACPLITHRLKKVMEALGPDFGERIQFVSLSVDPLGDGPEQLRAYAEKFELPAEGWTFLTGKPNAIETVIKRLGQRAGEPQVHTTMLLAGNVDGRHWRKLQAETTPRLLARQLQDMLAGTATGKPGAPPAR